MLNYYAIYDKSLKLANSPFPARDDNDAVRIVRNFIHAAGNDLFARIVPVCDLRRCGSFDEEACTFLAAPEDNFVVALINIPVVDTDAGGK